MWADDHITKPRWDSGGGGVRNKGVKLSLGEAGWCGEKVVF